MFPRSPLPLTATLLLLTVACSKPTPPKVEATAAPAATPPATAEPAATGMAATAAAPTAAPTAVRVGEAAPDFTLKGTAGESFTLAEHRGKIVVLEWFNPGCPFVKAAHSKGSLVDTAARAQKGGVVWVAINSGAPGKQGAGQAANEEAKRAFGLAHPVLLDESGEVGRRYGAERTPHLFVIDAKGTLVYAGAIDNSPDGEGESPTGGALVNYVDGALAALAAGKPVEPATTKSYGCTVKYGG